MEKHKPVLMIVDGVGAMGFLPHTLRLALRNDGDRFEVRNFVWTHGYGRMLADLRDRPHIIAKAKVLATEMNAIVEERKQLFVVAKSGGTAVALEALAQMPSESVEKLILLSSAVSPSFDLTPALNSVRTKAYAFNSHLDLVMLTFGTSIFGTADGIRTRAAGCVGFSNPERYEKLQEFKWNANMLRTLNTGEHFGTSMYPFLVEYVLPLLRDEA